MSKKLFAGQFSDAKADINSTQSNIGVTLVACLAENEFEAIEQFYKYAQKQNPNVPPSSVSAMEISQDLIDAVATKPTPEVAPEVTPEVAPEESSY